MTASQMEALVVEAGPSSSAKSENLLFSYSFCRRTG